MSSEIDARIDALQSRRPGETVVVPVLARESRLGLAVTLDREVLGRHYHQVTNHAAGALRVADGHS